MLTAGEDLVVILEDLRRTVRSIEAGVASLAGQGLLGLAGGCLLRALTEQGLCRRHGAMPWARHGPAPGWRSRT